MTYYLITDPNAVAAEQVRQRRARDECGLYEAARRIRREQTLNALEVLQEARLDDLRFVVNDLIEIIKGTLK